MEKQHFFDKPQNIRWFLRIFFALLVILLGLEFAVHRHSFFAWEKWPEFYAVYGFVAYVVLILLAKHVLRPLVIRREDYYDD